MKKCRACQLEKEDEDFYKVTKDGEKLSTNCKSCTIYSNIPNNDRLVRDDTPLEEVKKQLLNLDKNAENYFEEKLRLRALLSPLNNEPPETLYTIKNEDLWIKCKQCGRETKQIEKEKFCSENCFNKNNLMKKI
jgi:hypothetical protein